MLIFFFYLVSLPFLHSQRDAWAFPLMEQYVSFLGKPVSESIVVCGGCSGSLCACARGTPEISLVIARTPCTLFLETGSLNVCP